MSAQTGRASLGPPPPSSRGFSRVRGHVSHWRASPNPVWLREMKQSARLLRTPFILMSVTALTALLLCSIGGIMASRSSPATTGVALYHTFFSVAFFVITLAGPAVAANTIASEREGRTWEALLLTGLSPGVIARGKFLAAYTNVSLYIIMLAPVGALPFLFGGVTATEVIVAFVWLFLLAALSVAFGLAMSSTMESLRAAILVTVFLAMVISPTAYLTLGVALSFPAGELWPGVPKGPPVWLPTAYERAPFGLVYLGALVLAPLGSVGLPAWFLYEVTIANLTSVTDDRSSGLKRWFLVTSGALVLGSIVLVVGAPDRAGVGIDTLAAFLLFLVFCAFVFAGEPIGPSRRVRVRWEREGRGALARALGPGVMRASGVLLAAGLSGLALIAAAACALLLLGPGPTRRADAHGVLLVAGYAAAFFLFTAGFTAWMRARTNSPPTARVMLLVMLFFAGAGPWIVAAIAGAFSGSGADERLVVAAPSPAFALHAAAQVRRSLLDLTVTLLACAVSTSAWALLGLGLLGRAAMRCGAVIRAHDSALADSDAALAAEDAQRASGGPSTPAAAGEAVAPPTPEATPGPPREATPEAPLPPDAARPAAPSPGKDGAPS